MSADRLNLDAACRAGQQGEELTLLGDRYLPRGGVRHCTNLNALESSTRVAICGLSANEYYWRGTGNQQEYEILSRMPRCVRCVSGDSS